MNAVTFLLDAVSPVVLVIPAIILLLLIAGTTFGILWFIAYIRKRNKSNRNNIK